MQFLVQECDATIVEQDTKRWLQKHFFLKQKQVPVLRLYLYQMSKIKTAFSAVTVATKVPSGWVNALHATNGIRLWKK